MSHGPVVGHDAVFSGPQSFSTVNSISTTNSKLRVTTFLSLSGETYNRTLNIIVVKCFKSEPFLLNSFKLTFQSNDNAGNLGQCHFLLI